MALIKCPECGKEISNKSDVCIHCGYPLQKEDVDINSEYICKINGVYCDLSTFAPMLLNNEKLDFEFIGKEIRKVTGLSSPVKLIAAIRDAGKVPEEYNGTTLEESRAKYQTQQSAKPKCPHCGSTNIKKVSATSRLISTATFGIASNKIGKSFQCCKCKYTW